MISHDYQVTSRFTILLQKRKEFNIPNSNYYNNVCIEEYVNIYIKGKEY